MAANKTIGVDISEKELLEMTRDEAIGDLTDKQVAFCERFAENHNNKLAAIKAGYKPASATTAAVKIKSRKQAQLYIAWIKVRLFNKLMLRPEEILNQWIKIAFCDATDFVDIFPNSFRLKPGTEIDGQLIKSIKSGRDGLSLEFYDKLKALDSLIKYADCMPKDWKEKLEIRKLELQEKEFELKKQQADVFGEEKEDDGFMAAIEKSVEHIWENN